MGMGGTTILGIVQTSSSFLFPNNHLADEHPAGHVQSTVPQASADVSSRTLSASRETFPGGRGEGRSLALLGATGQPQANWTGAPWESCDEKQRGHWGDRGCAPATSLINQRGPEAPGREHGAAILSTSPAVPTRLLPLLGPGAPERPSVSHLCNMRNKLIKINATQSQRSPASALTAVQGGGYSDTQTMALIWGALAKPCAASQGWWPESWMSEAEAPRTPQSPGLLPLPTTSVTVTLEGMETLEGSLNPERQEGDFLNVQVAGTLLGSSPLKAGCS